VPEEQTISRQSIGCNFTRCVRRVCWKLCRQGGK